MIVQGLVIHNISGIVVMAAPVKIPCAERMGPKRFPKRTLIKSIAIAKKSAEASTAKIGITREVPAVEESDVALKLGATKTKTPTKPKKIPTAFFKPILDPGTNSASNTVAKRGTVPIRTAVTLLAKRNWAQATRTQGRVASNNPMRRKSGSSFQKEEGIFEIGRGSMRVASSNVNNSAPIPILPAAIVVVEKLTRANLLRIYCDPQMNPAPKSRR